MKTFTNYCRLNSSLHDFVLAAICYCKLLLEFMKIAVIMLLNTKNLIFINENVSYLYY